MLTQWQSAGVYQYVLPFLLIFAIVFGILSTTNILGTNKGLHSIIAVVIGLMAIGYSSSMGYSLGDFLQTLFPRLGIGLAVLVALMVLIGLFIPTEHKMYWMWGLGAIGVVIAIIIVAQTFSALNFYSFDDSSNYVGWIVGGVLLLGLIVAVSTTGSSGPSNPNSGRATMGPIR